MIQLEQRRRYPVPRERAFAYITDPQHWPEYWADLASIPDLDTARWQAPGDTMRLRMRMPGREVELHMTLTSFEPPSLVTYRSVQAGMPDAEHERRFIADGEGLEYVVVVRYEPRPGVAGLLDRSVIRLGIARAMRRTMDNLQQRLGKLGERA